MPEPPHRFRGADRSNGDRPGGSVRPVLDQLSAAGVRVTVTGRFTSPTTVSGHIAIHFNRVKGCNANRAFTAQRTAAAAPGPAAT